jgi:HAD superfamily phosphatase (TIGR01668 family)
MSKFYPDMEVKHLLDIDLDYLWQSGIRGMVFDLDNTITPWHVYDPDPDMVAWFGQLQKRGFGACILSNSMPARVQAICTWLNIPVLGNSKKPARSGFFRACQLLNLPPEQLAMVGDQLLTDIYGGNKAGFFTILTEPLADREFWGTKHISRRAERIIRRKWKNKS